MNPDIDDFDIDDFFCVGMKTSEKDFKAEIKERRKVDDGRLKKLLVRVAMKAHGIGRDEALAKIENDFNCQGGNNEC